MNGNAISSTLSERTLWQAMSMAEEAAIAALAAAVAELQECSDIRAEMDAEPLCYLPMVAPLRGITPGTRARRAVECIGSAMVHLVKAGELRDCFVAITSTGADAS